MKNILLSAYACEPNKGSEPGVGWSWAIELSQHHNVWVLTRDNNRDSIESYLRDHPELNMERCHFVYVRLSKILTFWKKGNRGVRLYYWLWQKEAYKVAKKWKKKICFDVVHHVTFVSVTQPTYMYRLGIPFIWGPIAGAENIPKTVTCKMTMKERTLEQVRKWSQQLAFYYPNTIKTLQRSKAIIVATEETKQIIPKKYLDKTYVMLAIGIDENLKNTTEIRRDNHKIKIIMVGRLIYWKMFELGIQAFLTLVDRYGNIELYVLGEGENKEELKKVAGKYLDESIFFLEPIEHDKIYEFYSQYDIFLNTSLRDSGCMAMLEAMSVGLPCICIATGGPKVLTNNISELQVEPQENTAIIAGIVQKLELLITNPLLRHQISNRILEESTLFSFANKYRTLCKLKIYH